ncbi:MAG: MGMT family protein [Phycisphaerales bacterium]
MSAAMPGATRRREVRVRTFDTADGEFFVAIERCGDRERLVETGWTSLRSPLPSAWRRDPRVAPELVARLRRALRGESVDFSDVELPEASPFFARCRRAVQRVPAGTTVSYGDLARRAGNGAASRAAGQAMRRNPTPIVVPCHRVIASTGAVGGFAGAWATASGPACPQTELKTRLIERERACAASVAGTTNGRRGRSFARSF